MNLRNILSSGVVILLFLVTVALYFGRGVFGCIADWWLDTTKALPVILLSITTWFAGGYKALPIALLLSACGDIAGEHGAFLWQIGFFAVAHIAFIIHFVRKAKVTRARLILVALWGIVMLLFGGFIVSHIENNIISIACSIYILIIGSMTAATLLIESRYRWCYIASALIFVFSDSCIAWNRFVDRFDGAGIAIMSTYFAAQLIFATLYLKER